MGRLFVALFVVVGFIGCESSVESIRGPVAVDDGPLRPSSPAPPAVTVKVVELVRGFEPVRDMFGELELFADDRLTMGGKIAIKVAPPLDQGAGVRSDSDDGIFLLSAENSEGRIEIEARWRATQDRAFIDSLLVRQPATGKTVTLVAPPGGE